MSRKAQPKTGLGKRLKELRDKKKLTQEELARELGFASGTVSRWEREVGSPQAEQLLVLKDYFDVTLDHLLLGAPPETPIMTDEFHRFLATAAGRYAKDHGLLPMLLHLKYPGTLTVDMYRGIVNAFRAAEEAALDVAPNGDSSKTPEKS